MASPSTYRVKLSFKNDRLVMPVERLDGNVFDAILAPATLRFRAQRLLSKDDSFIQVSTADGYIIDRNDLVKDVIERNDQLVLVNRDAWIADFKQNTKLNYWYDIKHSLAICAFIGPKTPSGTSNWQNILSTRTSCLHSSFGHLKLGTCYP